MQTAELGSILVSCHFMSRVAEMPRLSVNVLWDHLEAFRPATPLKAVHMCPILPMVGSMYDFNE